MKQLQYISMHSSEFCTNLYFSSFLEYLLGNIPSRLLNFLLLLIWTLAGDLQAEGSWNCQPLGYLRFKCPIMCLLPCHSVNMRILPMALSPVFIMSHVFSAYCADCGGLPKQHYCLPWCDCDYGCFPCHHCFRWVAPPLLGHYSCFLDCFYFLKKHQMSGH